MKEVKLLLCMGTSITVRGLTKYAIIKRYFNHRFRLHTAR